MLRTTNTKENTDSKTIIRADDVAFRVLPTKIDIESINNLNNDERIIYQECLPLIESCSFLMKKYETIPYSEEHYSRFEKEYWKIIDKLESAVRKSTDNKLHLKMKQIFRGRLYQYISQSYITSRASAKPFGYGGDYINLQYLYDEQVISPTNMGKYFDKMFITDPLSRAVIDRVNTMAQKLSEFILESKKTELHILNIASGSGFDLFQVAKQSINKKIYIHCFDQEVYSLLYLKNKMSTLQHNIQFVFYKEDILHFFKKWADSKKFDYIYNIGLADYLSDRILKNLMQESINALAEDGKFVLAHKDYKKFPYQYPAWSIGWEFFPRSLEEYHLFVQKNLKDFKTCNIFFESSKQAIYFGEFTK